MTDGLRVVPAMALPVANRNRSDWTTQGENVMCENCGINHETNELENQEQLNDFLNRLVGAGEALNDSDNGDLFDLLAIMFGEPEPVTSFMEERGLKPEFELSGTLFDGKPWTVKVAEIPLDQIEEEHRSHGSQWWALDGYYDGELVRSSEGAPPEPVSAKEAAEVFAQYHFDYIIPA